MSANKSDKKRDHYVRVIAKTIIANIDEQLPKVREYPKVQAPNFNTGKAELLK